MIRQGLKMVAAGANPMGVKRGMEQAVDAVVEEIRHYIPYGEAAFRMFGGAAANSAARSAARSAFSRSAAA